MAKSLGGPSGTAMPTKRGKGAGTGRGSQNPPDNAMAPIHTGKAEIRVRNKNGFGSVYRDRENKPFPKRAPHPSFGGGN